MAAFFLAACAATHAAKSGSEPSSRPADVVAGNGLDVGAPDDGKNVGDETPSSLLGVWLSS